MQNLKNLTPFIISSLKIFNDTGVVFCESDNCHFVLVFEEVVQNFYNPKMNNIEIN